MVLRFRTGYLAFNGQDASLLHYHMAKYIACGFDSLTWCDVSSDNNSMHGKGNMNFGQYILLIQLRRYAGFFWPKRSLYHQHGSHCLQYFSIWAFVKVPPNSGILAQKAKQAEWQCALMGLAERALNSALGLCATLGVNGFIGITVTSAGITLYGEALWDPLKLIDKGDNRAATFFRSFAFALSTLSTNISANTPSARNDTTVLCNIRRGQVICAFLGG